MIFRPWIRRMEALGARFHFGTAVRDFKLDPVSGRVTHVTAASKGGPTQVFVLQGSASQFSQVQKASAQTFETRA